MFLLLAQAAAQSASTAGQYDWLHALLGSLVLIVPPLVAKIVQMLEQRKAVDPEELAKWTAFAKACIQGIEAGGHDDTKAQVQKASQALGVAPELDKVVQSMTAQGGGK